MISQQKIKEQIDLWIIEFLEKRATRLTLFDMRPSHTQKDVTKFQKALTERAKKMREKLYGTEDKIQDLRPSGVQNPTQE